MQAPKTRPLLMRVVDCYHQALKQNPEVLEYLQTAVSTIPTSSTVSNRAWRIEHCLPPARENREAGAEIRGRLQVLGALRESGHNFSGSLCSQSSTIGQVLELYGRKLRDDLRKGTCRRHTLRETDARCR
jgi:hypothetical protein